MYKIIYEDGTTEILNIDDEETAKKLYLITIGQTKPVKRIEQY